MATLQEIIAKRQEMGPNATNVEARQALIGSVSPTPTPVAPVQTPVTPMVTAPVDTTTGLSKPLETTPATSTPVPTAPTPITPKVDATPGINQTTYAQAKAESEKIKAENEAVMEQNKQKADLATQDRQKIAEEARIASIPTDQKGIVSSLLSGVNIPIQKTQAYNNAVVIADQFKKFNGMTDVQLLDNLKQGQIGTELDSLLSQNPNYAKAKAELAKAQKTASINRATQIASNVISGKETPIVDDLANIEAKYNVPIGANEQAYTNYVTKNPDVVSAGTQVKQLSNQISTLTTSYNDALKSIKAQYGDMPASALLTLMGSRTNDTKTLLDSYINAKELAKGDFDLAMKMAEGHYNATAADIAQANILKNEQAKLQMTADFQKKQAQEALNDPATAIASVMEEYKKLGIPFTSTVQSRLAEFNASGKSLPEFLTEMSKNIQESPGYKAYAQKQGGTEWQSTSITRYNPATGANEPTPVFYRKKTDGSFEAVDLSGNKIDASSITGGGGATTNPPTRPTGNIVPVTAGNKTVRLDQSGAGGFENAVNQLITSGTPLTIGQGARDQVETIKSMASHFKIPFNPNNPVETAQKLRSAGHQVADPGKSNHETGMAIDVYSDSSMSNGPTPAQEKILNANGWYSAHIKGDAGHFEYRGAQGTSETDSSKYPSYIKYVESGQVPTGMKEGSAQFDQFQKDAETGYIQAKQKEVGASGFNIENPQAFSSTSKKQKEDISTAIQNVQPFVSSMDRVKELVKKYGTENPYSEGGKMINAEVKNAQLIAKEIYNLGVLNGPDLSLMEAIIANPTSIGSNLMPWQDYVSQLESGKQKILENMKAKAGSVGLSFGGNGNNTNTADNTNQLTQEVVTNLYNEWKANQK